MVLEAAGAEAVGTKMVATTAPTARGGGGVEGDNRMRRTGACRKRWARKGGEEGRERKKRKGRGDTGGMREE